jgi:hypothetical protein
MMAGSRIMAARGIVSACRKVWETFGSDRDADLRAARAVERGLAER